MYQKKRWAFLTSYFLPQASVPYYFPPSSYNEIFFMIDTCQANTMYTKFYSPNILATGSSQLGENSYSVRIIFPYTNRWYSYSFSLVC
jgi:hypothetical protein